MRVTRRESGFTIVEVIVAAIIITIVLAGMIYFFASAGRSQQRSTVRQQMAVAADRVMQDVRADRSWTSTACSSSGCQVPGHDYTPRSDKEPRFDTAVRAEPFDSPADGVGAMDRDARVPDFYNITVTVSLPAAEAAKWGKQQPLSLKSTFDANTIGSGATGSLTVEVCEVTNQVDERMAIEGCLNGEQRLQMRPQPEPCGLMARDGFLQKTADEARDDYEKERYFGLNCNRALEEASRVDNRHTVKVRPGSTQFTLTPTLGSGGVGVWTNVMADNFSDKVQAVGSYTFSSIPAGTYQLSANPGGNKEIWKTKGIPQDDRVTVEANKKARALIVVRPKQDTGTYEVLFSRKVYRYVIRSWSSNDPSPQGIAIAPTDPSATPTQVSTTYTYVRAFLTETPTWKGVSFSGFVGLEPKPFDRYHEPNASRTPQQIKELTWEPSNAGDDEERAKLVFSKDNGLGLPTGLHSIPEQLDVRPEGLFGTFGTRKLVCQGGPCTDRDTHVWLDENGSPNSRVEYHDGETGECYVRSEVPGTTFDWELINGGEQPDTGEAGGDRCERDVMINGTLVKDFMPDRQGNGGKTVVFKKQQTVQCQGAPPATGSCPTMSGMISTVRPDENTIGEGGTEKKPTFSLDTNSVITCSAGGQLIAGLTGVPCTGLAAVTGAFYGPSMAAPPAIALPTIPCVFRCGGAIN